MILEKVIFCIDTSDIHEYARAVRKLSEYEAMGKIAEVIPCIGSFEGKLEHSFMMLARDFDKHIKPLWFMDNQQCILRVPGDVRQPCVLEYLESGARLSIGPMRQIPKSKVHYGHHWTYVIETDSYYTTEEIN